MRILLMGNPNVGKSALFSRLTGSDVVISNYSGTTVEYSGGSLSFGDEPAELIDVPGTFSLNPANKAEKAAVQMLDEADLIINVADATHLERNLYLTLQLLRQNRPLLLVLNMWDDSVKQNITTDLPRLEAMLGIPVVATCAVDGRGIETLKQKISSLLNQKRNKQAFKKNSQIPNQRTHTYPCESGDLPAADGEAAGADPDLWNLVDNIVRETQTRPEQKENIPNKFSHATVHPLWGPIIAVLILFLSFGFVAYIGDFLHEVLDDVFEWAWLPVTGWISAQLGQSGLIHNLLIGTLIDGSIDFEESFGLLTTGLFIPLAVVLPFIFCFYCILSLLEDIGYLPRLGVVVDSLMQRLGIHGLSVVPMMLGIGCNVPGVMAGRMLETRKERFIAATLIAIAIPCMAQQAMVIGLLGQAGLAGLAIVYATLFVLWVVLGWMMNLFLRGEASEMLIDLPPYRLPYWRSLGQKIYMRMMGFIRNALPYVLLGVFVVNVLYTMGVIGAISSALAPVMTGLFGLPGEAGGALIVGFLRKDVAVGMLAPLGMELAQLIVASVVLMVYFPCVATFVVLFKELGFADLIKLLLIMILIVLFTGGGLHLLLQAAGM